MRMTQKTNPLHLLKDHHKVVLLTHIHPDGDAYGSMLGLLHLLKDKVRQVKAFAKEDPSSKFSFLPGFGDIQPVSEIDEGEADYCIVLDCGNLQRASGMEAFQQSKGQMTVVNLDHHVSNTRFGHVHLVDEKSSSTSELVASLAVQMEWPFSPDAATCLLTGIVMDTGHYLYENTTANTHEMAASLLRAGADQNRIRYQLYQSRPIQNVRFMGYLIDHMEMRSGGCAVLVSVTDKIIKQFGIAYEDLDEMIAYARDIEGVELAVILKELSETETKVSFRSKCWLDVNQLASHLGGGGHHRAAGAVVKGSLQEAAALIIPLMEAAFAEVTNENGAV